MRWLLAAVAATASVELVVFPIQVWWFSRLSFAGLALNLVAVPLMTVAQVAGPGWRWRWIWRERRRGRRAGSRHTP